MKPTQGLYTHVGVFGLAIAFAWYTAERKAEPSEGRPVEATLWGGTADQVESIQLTSDDQVVRVAPAKDAVGRYAVVEVTRLKTQADEVDAKASLPKSDAPKRFISVDAIEALLPSIAPAKSYRTLGKLEPSRLGDYGLDKPEANLTVKIAGTEHRLDIGALTPGSGDYYVRDPATKVVCTLAAEAITRLKFGESRLVEHDLHGFKADDVKAVTVSAGGKSRRLLRIEGKSAWATPETPAVQDETAGNWLLKVQRVRPQTYVEKPADMGTAFARIEYSDGKAQLGYLELYRSTSNSGKYFAKSERSRWIVEVPKSVVEPIDQDLGSVIK